MPVAPQSKGLKRICLNCGIRFYDFNKAPIICPNCDTEYVGEARPKGRRSRAADPVKAAAPVKEAEAVMEDEEEDTGAILGDGDDDDVVSLDDVDEDDDDLDDSDDIELDDDLGSLDDLEEDDDDVEEEVLDEEEDGKS